MPVARATRGDNTSPLASGKTTVGGCETLGTDRADSGATGMAQMGQVMKAVGPKIAATGETALYLDARPSEIPRFYQVRDSE